MSRRNFNWNFRTAHPLGESSVKDNQREERMFAREQANLTNEQAKARQIARQRERHDFFLRHPHLKAS